MNVITALKALKDSRTLERVKAKLGRNWKSKVVKAWMDGRYPVCLSVDECALLQQMRNGNVGEEERGEVS